MWRVQAITRRSANSPDGASRLASHDPTRSAVEADPLLAFGPRFAAEPLPIRRRTKGGVVPDIVHSIGISARPDVLFPLISSGPGFQEWWAEDVVVMPDGAVELGFFSRATVYRLRAVGRETARKAVWECETGQEWSGTRLAFELEVQGATTLTRFTHSGWRRATDFFVSCNTTWGGLMFRLKAAAEGRAPGPLFLANSLAY